MQHALPLKQGPGHNLWLLPSYGNTECWKDYHKGKVLGKGTYGTTYLANHRDTSEKVAVKVSVGVWCT